MLVAYMSEPRVFCADLFCVLEALRKAQMRRMRPFTERIDDQMFRTAYKVQGFFADKAAIGYVRKKGAAFVRIVGSGIAYFPAAGFERAVQKRNAHDGKTADAKRIIVGKAFGFEQVQHGLVARAGLRQKNITETFPYVAEGIFV